MSVDRTGVKSATFTFSGKPELLVGGKKKPFEDMVIGGKPIKGVVLSDGSVARLDKRQDGRWDVTLTARDGKDLSKRKIHIGEGGRISRLGNLEGDVYKLKNNQKLMSGKTIRLNEKLFNELTKNLEPISQRIEIRSPKPQQKKEDDRQDDITLTESPPPLRRRNARARLDDLPDLDTVQIQVPKEGVSKKEELD